MKTITFTVLSLSLLLSACSLGEAREATVGDSTSALVADAPAPPARRVWTEPDDFGEVSPTEPIISFVDWRTGGDVAVHDLSTGEDRLLTNHGSPSESRGWSESPVFSPDGSQIVYAFGNVRVPEVESGEQPFRYQLRIVELDGSGDHPIWEATNFREFTTPMDWSEARGIVVATWNDEIPSGALALISPEDGRIEVLSPFEEGIPCPCADDAKFSPDEAFLVYRKGAATRLVKLDTGEERDLEIEARTIVAWTRDGSGFLIHATRQGISGFWHVPVSGSGEVGVPTLVRGGIPFATTAGRSGEDFYYYVPVEGPQLFQTSVDLEASRVLSAPTPLTPVALQMVGHPTWSPDGRQLAYALVDVDRNWSIRIRSSDGTEVTTLTDLGQVRSVQYFTWSADGSTLFFMTYRGDERHLHRTDVRTGVTEEILAFPPDHGPVPAYITPDGTHALIVRGFAQVQAEGPAPAGLVIRDLETGEERMISDTPPESIKLSPDGSTIAALVTGESGRYRRLYLQPLDGGDPTLLAEHDREEGAIQSRTGLSWSRDGRYILTTYWTAAHGDTPERWDMMAFPVDGGEPFTLGQVTNPGASPTLHPDGRRIVYVDGYLKGEIWVMEGWR